MLNNYSKDSAPIFVATVVSFDDQKEQVTGLGWGWRCKIAMHPFTSSSVDIKDEELEYAIILAANSDGTGAADRRRSARIRQGDTVVGIKIGGKRGLHVFLEHFQEPKIQFSILVDLVQSLVILVMINQKVCLEVIKNLVNVPDMKVPEQLLDVLIKIRQFLRRKKKIYFLSLV